MIINGDNLFVEELKKLMVAMIGLHFHFSNQDINANTEIWNFVSKYNVNGLIDCGVRN